MSLGQVCYHLEPNLRPNKKISVFQVTGLNILGRVGTHFFFCKKYNLMHFENLKKILGFTSELR